MFLITGSVYIWNAIDGRLLTSLVGCHQRGVSSVSFNKEGTLLLAIGQDNNNQHTIWKDVGGQWSRTQQVATEKGDQNPVLFSNWIETQAGGGFVSGGGNAILFWKLEGSVSFF